MATTASDREQHRARTRGLRDNAGIDARESIEAVADFGAAARRLRASVRGGTDLDATSVMVRRPAAAVRAHEDAARRHQQLAARAGELLAAVEDEKSRAAHPAGTGRRFRLRSVR